MRKTERKLKNGGNIEGVREKERYGERERERERERAVSYTHLTLPTILLV